MKKIKKSLNTIDMKGEVFDDFETEDNIKEIILLGKKGKIRRIILK